MKPTPTLLAASSLLAVLSSTAVRADDGIITFELAPPAWAEAEAIVTAVAPAQAMVDPANQPLPIPARAANPPMRYHSPQQLPAGVYRHGVAAALNADTPATALLPPAPPPPTHEPVMVAVAPPSPVAATPISPLPTLFEGHSDSLVAWAVGSAEGTRTPNGGINRAYFGHTDPGNRAWNMGTFSYQHGAKTPEEADQKQLVRLQGQGEVLRRRALSHGLNLTLAETLNGLDLANQSPLAAIGQVGYIERLAEAKRNGLEGTEAILVARTRSYINPKTGRWNAPGLGNTEASIRRDQQRRATMVAKAIAAYTDQHPQFQAHTWVLAPAPESLVAETPLEPVDDVIFRVWTSPSDPQPPTPLAALPGAVPESTIYAPLELPPLAFEADDPHTLDPQTPESSVPGIQIP